MDDKDKLLPQFTENIDITKQSLPKFENQELWELILHIYPKGSQRSIINTYGDFLTSNCICCVIYYDCGSLEIYIKSLSLFQQIWDKLTILKAEDMSVITDENDSRTVLHL